MFAKKILGGLLLFAWLILPKNIFARENVTDWYIKDFQSEIIVNKDATLDITEKIIADCGNAFDKHGIFRILPTQMNVDGEIVKTPVELSSITDQSGASWKYSQSINSNDKTITWKIGDQNVAVKGENVFIIKYRVKNVLRFGDEKFDELYWNLNGNFWDLETDKFHATIKFPQEITAQNAIVEYYTGALGSKDKSLAEYYWSAPSVLEFSSLGTLGRRQGITASIIFPKNIIIPYQFSFWEKYGAYLFFILPVLVLLCAFLIWKKYGDDPEMNKTIIPEYEAPGNLSPIELGMLITNGKFSNALISAELINFASKGILTIEKTEQKVLLFTTKDYKIKRLQNVSREAELNPAQKTILEALFVQGDEVKLSDLRNKFYKNLPDIKSAGVKLLKEKGCIVESGLNYAAVFTALGGVFVAAGLIPFFADDVFGIPLMAALILSGIILLIFSLIMPKRTPLGAELNWQSKGFKLFMETAEKYRAQFYEKENIFEKILPYAIVFGIAKLWVEKMKDIYGEEFYVNYIPAWYVGSVGNFDANSLLSTIDGISSDIATAASAPSGSGARGAGGSGGGGGGGGGGGW